MTEHGKTIPGWVLEWLKVLIPVLSVAIWMYVQLAVMHYRIEQLEKSQAKSDAIHETLNTRMATVERNHDVLSKEVLTKIDQINASLTEIKNDLKEKR
jgi:septal ring factor EnvC (AmiA/AmiB activator)